MSFWASACDIALLSASCPQSCFAVCGNKATRPEGQALGWPTPSSLCAPPTCAMEGPKETLVCEVGRSACQCPLALIVWLANPQQFQGMLHPKSQCDTNGVGTCSAFSSISGLRIAAETAGRVSLELVCGTKAGTHTCQSEDQIAERLHVSPLDCDCVHPTSLKGEAMAQQAPVLS